MGGENGVWLRSRISVFGLASVKGAKCFRFPVASPEGPHPFPFRTRKLSPPGPMVLRWQRRGRVGRRRGSCAIGGEGPLSQRRLAALDVLLTETQALLNLRGPSVLSPWLPRPRSARDFPVPLDLGRGMAQAHRCEIQRAMGMIIARGRRAQYWKRCDPDVTS